MRGGLRLERLTGSGVSASLPSSDAGGVGVNGITIMEQTLFSDHELDSVTFLEMHPLAGHLLLPQWPHLNRPDQLTQPRCPQIQRP